MASRISTVVILALISTAQCAHHLPGELPAGSLDHFKSTGFAGGDTNTDSSNSNGGDLDLSGFGGDHLHVDDDRNSGSSPAEPSGSVFDPHHHDGNGNEGHTSTFHPEPSNPGGSQGSHRPKPRPQPQHDCRPFDRRRLIPFGKSSYYFSWRENLQEGWRTARDFCRAYCMDLVTVDSPKEHNFLAKHIAKDYLYGLWTGGRLCSRAKKCINYPHWFWAPTSRKIEGANWSPKGGVHEPQPDNLSERFYGPREECLAILNNWYQDGIKWHDLVCDDRLPFVCEGPAQTKRPAYRPQPRPAQRPAYRPQPLPYRKQGYAPPHGY